MQTLEELYRHLLKQGADGKPLAVGGDADPKLIGCLIHPEDKPLIWRVKPCLCPPDSPRDCQTACEWDAVALGDEGVVIDDEKCVGCQACVDACKLDALKTSKEIILSFKNCANMTDRSMRWLRRPYRANSERM